MVVAHYTLISLTTCDSSLPITVESTIGRVGERLEQTWYHATITVCMNHMKGNKYVWPAGNYNLANPVMSDFD